MTLTLRRPICDSRCSLVEMVISFSAGNRDSCGYSTCSMLQDPLTAQVHVCGLGDLVDMSAAIATPGDNASHPSARVLILTLLPGKTITYKDWGYNAGLAMGVAILV